MKKQTLQEEIDARIEEYKYRESKKRDIIIANLTLMIFGSVIMLSAVALIPYMILIKHDELMIVFMIFLGLVDLFFMGMRTFKKAFEP